MSKTIKIVVLVGFLAAYVYYVHSLNIVVAKQLEQFKYVYSHPEQIAQQY